MSWTKRGLALALVVALLSAPIVSAQESSKDNPNVSTPTTLYFHIFDTFNKFVINTQATDSSAFEVGGTNFPTLDNTPVNEVYGADFDFNSIYGVSTAGPVEYDVNENGRPRYHPEPGIAADVTMDQNTVPMAYVYLEPRDVLGCGASVDNCQETPNCLPGVNVRVTMRTGDDFRQDADLDVGTLLMQGQTTKTLCNAGGTPLGSVLDPVAGGGNGVAELDADGVAEFAVPMTFASGTIPKAQAYNIRIDWWQEDPTGSVCGDEGDAEGPHCSEGFLRIRNDADHLDRLELNIMNPIYTSFLHPQVAQQAGALLIHSGMNSPWGTYDVDEDNIKITITGPSQPVLLEKIVAANTHVHGLHDQDLEVTYLWNFRDEKAKLGTYGVELEVMNDANNAKATISGGFILKAKEAIGIDDTGETVAPTGGDATNDSPGVGMIALLGALGAALVTLRRRS